MRDEEIATTPKSSFVPEQDIRLVKAFGKFVEEAGELQEITNLILVDPSEFSNSKHALEDEIADCSAMIQIIRAIAPDSDVKIEVTPANTNLELSPALQYLNLYIARCLTVIGRCQIQGVNGISPNTKRANAELLEEALVNCIRVIHFTISDLSLDRGRIRVRSQGKISLKLPWVMELSDDQ